MVKNEICLWGASKQNILFFKICAPKKRTCVTNAPASKVNLTDIYYVYVMYMCISQCLDFWQNVTKISRWFCIYVSPQNKITRKSCSHVTNATTFPTPAGQPPKIFQIIHVNNWLWQNYCLKEILDELLVKSENGVTLARRILANIRLILVICYSHFNLELWYFKYGEQAFLKCE